MIFQDPYASLDPRTPIADSIGEGLRIHGIGTRRRAAEKVRRMMDLVGLAPWHASRYPHEFSGGQRQRIGIARALVLEPDLVVCDEPVSALDVSIQAQVLNLLKQLQRELGLTYLFVAHNMGVVEHISDRVAVMYLGRVAELADRRALFRSRSTRTPALMSAIPVPDPTIRRTRVILKGDVPSPVNPPTGCRFHPRCPLREQLGNPAICAEADPAPHRHRRRPPVRLPLPRPAAQRSAGARGTPAVGAPAPVGRKPGRSQTPRTCRACSTACRSPRVLRREAVGRLDLGALERTCRAKAGAANAAICSSVGPRSAHSSDASAVAGVPRRTEDLAQVGDPDVGLERLVGEVAGRPVSGDARHRGERRIDRPALLGLAESLVEPAPRVEAAAGRRVDRARHVALQDHPACACARRPDREPGRPTAAPACTGGPAPHTALRAARSRRSCRGT